MDGLNPRQRRFVEAYAGNATEAAIAAGYPEHRAQNLAKNPKVIAAIKARDGAAVTASTPIDELITSRIARQRRYAQLALTGDGDMLRLKALELLSKSCGDFIEKVHVTGEVQYRVVRDPYSNADETRTALEVALAEGAGRA